ncbi:unnamed protein product [Linum trigynum]|uniref:Bifunctional inhibitor/plant lipid transfer protein/seed storage helical domain-containing protein n=1 Tax=Linum trigynum TaxID=586398 RepID=A0AAV2GPE7_9ROSI
MSTTRTTALSMGIVLLTVQLLCGGGSRAQSSDCSTVLTSLTPCLGYISGTDSSPNKTCCSQLDKVVRLSPLCLCQLLSGGGSSFGIPGFNQTQALELPAACNVQTPPVSSCNAASPSASPGGSPVPLTPSSREGLGGAPGTSSSDGSSIKAPTSLLLFFFFITAASYCYSASMRY